LKPYRFRCRCSDANDNENGDAENEDVELLSAPDGENRSKILSWLASKVAALEAPERENNADKMFEVFSAPMLKVHLGAGQNMALLLDFAFS
jgi:hypothetical protein